MDQGSPRIRSSPTRARRSLREVLAATLAAALLLTMSLPAGPASAHTYLLSSDPADGATVGAVPGQVRLEFTEQVALEFASATVSASDGPAYGALTEMEGRSLIVRVPPGAATSQPGSGPSTWEIAYRVTAGDGHPVNETLSFAVLPDSGGAAESVTPEGAPRTSAESGAWAPEVRPRQIPGWVLLSLGSLTAVAVLVALWAVRRQALRA